MTWKRELQTGDRFYPLSGDEGREILIFRGDPEETESNLQPGKTEYHFSAYRGEIIDDLGKIEWEPVIVTESGDNFLAHLTSHQEAMGWGKPVTVSWKMRTSKKGRKFKDYRIVPVAVPNMPQRE